MIHSHCYIVTFYIYIVKFFFVRDGDGRPEVGGTPQLPELVKV